MMERLHVTDDPANIGYYSGLVDSCFAIAQLLTVSIAPFHVSPLPFAHHHHAVPSLRYINGANGQTA